MTIDLLSVSGFAEAVRAMRLPYESGAKSDSGYCSEIVCNNAEKCPNMDANYHIGNADIKLMRKLIKAGAEHRKFLRMIVCWFEINAPRCFYQQLDTYKVGTVCSSSSTMHLLTKRDLTQDDFEIPILPATLEFLNFTRNDKELSEAERLRIMKNNLPESFLQKRVYMMSYETLLNIHRQRKAHRLYEWQDIFCPFVETLPYFAGFLSALN